MPDELAVLMASIKSRRLHRLLDDWDRWRAGREFPARADFQPEQIAYLLGNVILLDVLYEPLRFRYRLIGSNLTQRRRYDLTGRFIDDNPDVAFRATIVALNQQVIASRRPQRSEYRTISTGPNEFFDYEALNLPLSDDGHRINMILSGSSFPGEE